jgi:hypothetical protein
MLMVDAGGIACVVVLFFHYQTKPLDIFWRTFLDPTSRARRDAAFD